MSSISAGEGTAGGFIRQLLILHVLVPLFLLATGFNVLFHAPTSLPGLLPLFAANLEHLLGLLQLAVLLGNHLIELGNKGLPGLQASHGHHPLLVGTEDRKSTRLNSSHVRISYAVFCL